MVGNHDNMSCPYGGECPPLSEEEIEETVDIYRSKGFIINRLYISRYCKACKKFLYKI
jgi:hypothetical protein